MRRFIFFTLFFHFSWVICTITISVTGPVFAGQPATITWTREQGDMEILRVFKQRPGQRQESQVPALVIDTNSALSGIVTIVFDGTARIRQVTIKDSNDVVVAESEQFPVQDPLPSTLGPSIPTKSGAKPSETPSRDQDKTGFANPAVLGSVVAAGGVVMIILAMLMFFTWRLKRRRRKHYAQMDISSPTSTFNAPARASFRYSDGHDFQAPRVVPPPRPPRNPELEDDLDFYHISTPNSTLQAERHPQITINTAAGRVHSHQASLVPISPFNYDPSPLSSSPPDRKFLGRMDSPGLGAGRPLPSPGLISPFNNEPSPFTTFSPNRRFLGLDSPSPNDQSPLTSSPPERRFLGHVDSPVPLSPAASFDSTSPILTRPPERFSSRDSKRYLAYVEAQRSRAEAERERAATNLRAPSRSRNAEEGNEGWTSSWQEVTDPPPSYPGHINRI